MGELESEIAGIFFASVLSRDLLIQPQDTEELKAYLCRISPT